jgi:methylene-tetrahydromethanopterin dehydrogenase
MALKFTRKKTRQFNNGLGGQMAKNILHMMTPLAHMSPFDVNMALDAGYDATASYTNVSLDQVTDLVQDAMFSRSPRDAVRTGVFIGGKDALLALDMLEAAGKALFKPFEISLFADPAGSFTTAAAMIAVVEKTLREKKGRALRGAAVSVFGATGVVGTASGVIAALEGASVTFVGRDGMERASRHANEVNRRFGVNIAVVDGTTPQMKTSILAGTEIVLCTSKAGVRVLDAAEIAHARKLLIAADVNAVPPSGIEGVDAHANGTPLGEHGALGIGALAIGNVKYRTESGLFKQMTESKIPLRLDFRQAFELARTLA